MMTAIPFGPTAGTLLVAVALLAACGRGGDDDAGAARMDTANASWEDGLSAQQVETEARALSPEEAEAQGLTVDTTIHLEVRAEDDTLVLPRDGAPTPPPVAPGDTAAAPR
jgi:hypothetical protein